MLQIVLPFAANPEQDKSEMYAADQKAETLCVPIYKQQIIA